MIDRFLNTSSKTTLSLIGVALKAKWTHLLLIVLLNAGSAVLEGSTMVALLLSLNILFEQTFSEMGSWPATIVGWLGVGENKKTLFFIFIFSAIALQILKSCIEFLSRVVSTRLRTHVSLYVQSQVTSKLLSLEYKTLSQIPIGTQNSYFVIADQVAKTLTIALINPVINSVFLIVVYLILLMMMIIM